MQWSTFYRVSSLLLALCLLPGCAYNWGKNSRGLPSGYKQIQIPVFLNFSQEPVVESYFTSALIKEFERSKVARLTNEKESEAFIEGEIVSLKTLTSNPSSLDLPVGVTLSSNHAVQVEVKVSLKRKSDRALIWSGVFRGSRDFIPSQVTTAGVNTVNSIYNLSARRQNIELLAADLMSQAFDRMTENF
jgi:hypothetical protein